LSIEMLPLLATHQPRIGCTTFHIRTLELLMLLVMRTRVKPILTTEIKWHKVSRYPNIDRGFEISCLG
jgi:hypothetical protein